MTEPTPAPESTPTPATPSDRPPRSRRRGLLVAGGAVLAAAVLAGGGIAVGAALADDDDDERVGVSSDGDTRTSVASDDDGSRAGGADDEVRDATATASSTPSALLGTDSPDELLEIIAAGSAAADGDPVSVEAEQDGSWDVELRTSAGDETKVRVSPDGHARVRDTDPADGDGDVPQGVLDAQTVRALVAAALAEFDGRILDIEIDDDGSPFDVTVLTDDGRIVDIDLDANMAVVGTSIG